MKNKLHFIITGGTIDSYYDGIKDTAVPNKESQIPNFIKSLKLYKECEFTTLWLKWSTCQRECMCASTEGYLNRKR